MVAEVVHRAEPITATPRCRTGESPLWVEASQRLYWVDIPAGELHWLATDTGKLGAAPIGAALGFVAQAGNGDLVLGSSTALRLTAELGSDAGACGSPLEHRPLWQPPDLTPSRRINDGSCDPRGRVVFGTTAVEGAAVLGTLWCYDPDVGGSPLITGVGMSNGVGWSEDACRMYYVDTRTRQLAAYPYDADSGSLVGRRQVLHDIPQRDGLPDGLAVDEEGCVWLAVWGAGEVRRLSPDGAPLARVHVPTPNVTSCAFGGPQLDRLFITTAASGPEGGSLDGRLFTVDAGVRGLPVQTVRFGGG